MFFYVAKDLSGSIPGAGKNEKISCANIEILQCVARGGPWRSLLNPTNLL